MSEVCPKCGLPKALCVCETIAREEQVIKVSTIKRKFGKVTTLIEGLDEKSVNIKEITKKLKEKFACGGTAKNGIIELQGDHKKKVKDELTKIGFAEETIKVN
ncbi:MAG: translation initiation factor [Candidatus Woesearchaeota archaeon]|nr:MAG: translation initiation factor [Candidatus Woesearchaeota archaeon]